MPPAMRSCTGSANCTASASCLSEPADTGRSGLCGRRDDDDRDLPAGLGLVPAVAAVVVVIDRLPQARVAGVAGRDDARPRRCPHPADLDLDVRLGLDVE